MRKAVLLTAMLLASVLASGQQVIKLWPDGAPNDNGLSGPENVMQGGRIGNISDPELLVFPAAEPNGLAVIMCPGGGYAYVAAGHEGTDMAAWFNAQGITYAVLKYRMPNGHADVPLTDAQRAISLMRSRADEWGIRKVGIMGGSASGHLAATASVHFTARTRPDFQILLYPLITFEGRVTPGGRNLLFDMYPEEEEVEYYCCEKHVTPNCPPAFIVHCEDDNTVPLRDSQIYVQALEANGVPVQYLVYPDGGHGFGFRDSFAHKQEWTSALAEWLKTR
ncbi:MAG: alpha/beta hydrolase [Bacteroidales bacterium]|nr:alpha/beta hydrolase [Bacteroidales bacterium]